MLNHDPQPSPQAPVSQLAPVETPPEESPQIVHELRVYSHTPLLYWWPVWAVGYLMAALTYFQGTTYTIDQTPERFHSSSNLGVAYFLTLFLVILITNVSIRGLASGLVILAGALVATVFALMGWWDTIFSWFGDLKIHMNFGSYFWFSNLMFVTWLISVFIIDRMSYWHFTSGQVTHQILLGGGSKSYDTNGIVLEKHRDNLFRHWILGFGSGDISIMTTGAVRERIDVPNVLFVGSKTAIIQRLAAEEPS